VAGGGGALCGVVAVCASADAATISAVKSPANNVVSVTRHIVEHVIDDVNTQLYRQRGGAFTAPCPASA
jgi:hypothetical protein